MPAGTQPALPEGLRLPESQEGDLAGTLQGGRHGHHPGADQGRGDAIRAGRTQGVGGSGCGPPAATPTGRSHAGAEPGGRGEAAGGARRRRKSPPGCNYLGTKLLSLPSPPGEISFISYIIPSPRTSPSTPTTAHSSAPTPSPAWAGGWVQGGGRPEVMAHTHQVSPAQDRTLTAGAPSPLLGLRRPRAQGPSPAAPPGSAGAEWGPGRGMRSPRWVSVMRELVGTALMSLPL